MKKVKKLKNGKKKTSWFTRLFAWLGGACVLGAAVFSTMWFVPAIHDKVWTPPQHTEQEQPTQQTNQEQAPQENKS